MLLGDEKIRGIMGLSITSDSYKVHALLVALTHQEVEQDIGK
jgi:hypothetical protein